SVDVDGEIAAAMVVEGHVDGALLFIGGFDAADVGPFGQAGHVAGDIRPGLAAVARDLQVAVVGAGVEHSGADGRFGDGGDTGPGYYAIVHGKGVATFGDFAEDGLLVTHGVGGEVLAEADPGVAAIGRFEEVIAAVVQSLGIVGGNDER